MSSMIFSAVRGIQSLLTSKTYTSSPSDDHEANVSGPIKVLSVAWNQDWTAFIVGTNRGFSVYSVDVFIERIKHNMQETGIKMAEMLFLSNIFALVGNSDKYPPNKLFIWDDFRKCCSRELSFKTIVVAVRLSRDRIVVVLEREVCVYNFKDLVGLCLIETTLNPKGLCCLSQVDANAVLACPGLHQGQVQVHDLKKNRIKLIKAHDSDLACMTLTLDGRLLATCSVKGTLIRIFNALDGTLLQELRRGVERVEIYSVAISLNLKWVAATSDKGTLHVFRLRPDILSSPKDITRASSFSFIRGMLPKYVYDNERSFAQFSLPVSTKFIVGFGPEDKIRIVGIDGSYRVCGFDGEGGQMEELEKKSFLSWPKTDDK